MKQEYKSIFDYCLSSAETDCVKLATRLMDLANVPIHGPVHHFIVPAAMLTCYNNLYGNKEQLAGQLDDAAERAGIVPGANCALCGACGAGLGMGQFASIITKNTPLSEESWSKVMQVSSACGAEIAKHGGPRCCKRDTYIAITKGTEKIKELLGVELETKNAVVCKYFPKNEQCRKEACLFYPRKK